MVLKLGSKGKEVKELQGFLEITADGIFGKGTESSVKKYQKNNGLTVDGIVGPATLEHMGIIDSDTPFTTDDSERIFETFNGLHIHRHYLPWKEYKQGPVSPEYVFLHHTAGWNNPFRTIDHWGRDSRGAVCTEFVLGGQSVKGNDEQYDGTLVQAFPEGNYGWHLGKNGNQKMHVNSVGIEVNNFGYIVDGKTYAGTRVVEDQIVTLDKPFRGYKTWHKYSDDQIETLRLWILYIADRDNIDVTKGLVEEVKAKGADGFEFNSDAYYGRVKGMWTHTNTRKDKFDMFPQPELLDMLLTL